MKKVIGVSVIMPVYNEEKYIREAIDSILLQTYPFIELIIVNDASTDRTDAIVRSYADERLVYLASSEHQGTYKCRNRAIQVAKGQFLAIMDADDIAMPERLERQYQYLEEHPEVLAVGSDCVFFPVSFDRVLPQAYEKILLALLRDNVFVHSSLMVRTSAFQEIGGYDERYLYSADYDLVCRLALAGKMRLESRPDITLP